MGICFERVLANAGIMEVNTHRRTNGTFIRFETLNIIIPVQKDFRVAWFDERANWMKVSRGNKTSIVEVICLISLGCFENKFPEAVQQAKDYKAYERFEKKHSFYAGYRFSAKKRRLYA